MEWLGILPIGGLAVYFFYTLWVQIREGPRHGGWMV